MKRHALKNIMAAAAVTVSALLVQGCDVMWGTAIDSDPYYDGGYYGDGYYGTGFYNNWWPTLSGPAWSGNWGNASYPGNYIPPSWTPTPRPPHSRPPQWNGGGNPGPVINIGNVRPGNSGANPGGNPGPAIPPQQSQPSQPSRPSTPSTGNNRPPFTLTPSELPSTGSSGSGQRPGHH